MPSFVLRTPVGARAEDVLPWHGRARRRLLPPWDPRLSSAIALASGEGKVIGALETLAVGSGGPFRGFEHHQTVTPTGPQSCALEDRLHYELLAGPASWGGHRRVREQIDRLFTYRQSTAAGDLAAYTRVGNPSPMRLVISGASGLLGSSLAAFLAAGGHTVVPLTRAAAASRAPSAGLATSSAPSRENAGAGEMIFWDPARGQIEAEGLDGVDAVVHLAAENIGAGRWTAKRKQGIRDSRLQGTSLLSRTLASLRRPPRVLVSVSAVGFYGDRGAERLTEESPAGDGFLAQVCRSWEESTAPARDAAVRVVVLRLGVVLTAAGGALPQMLLPFRLGLGGPLGGGNQFMSWISLDDLCDVILRAITADDLRGPVNAVAPYPSTNRELTRLAGRILRRPAVLPAPAWALRWILGEMAQEMLLSSAAVYPTRLEAAGHRFRHPDLETALRHTLGMRRS